MPKMTIPSGVTLNHGSFAALKKAISEAFNTAKREAEGCGCKFIRPRERRLIAVDDKGRLNPPHDEPWTWDGTLTELLKCATEMRCHGANAVIIDGGFDGSEFFDFSDYDPWIGEWDLEACKMAAPALAVRSLLQHSMAIVAGDGSVHGAVPVELQAADRPVGVDRVIVLAGYDPATLPALVLSIKEEQARSGWVPVYDHGGSWLGNVVTARQDSEYLVLGCVRK